MTSRSIQRSCVLVALLAWAPGLLAQPPVGAPAELHGPIDPCTVGNYAEPDVLCELCPLANDAPGACGKRLAELGYRKQCTTRQEAAEHGEVWCKSKRVATVPKPKPEETQATLRWVVLAGATLLAGGLAYRFRKPPPK